MFANVTRAADGELPGPALPQQKLHQPFGVEEILCGAGVIFWKNDSFITRDSAMRSFQCDNERRAACFFCGSAKGPIGQGRWPEIGIKRRQCCRRNKFHHNERMGEKSSNIGRYTNFRIQLIAKFFQRFLTFMQRHMRRGQHHRVHHKQQDAAHGGLNHICFQ